MAIRNVSWLAAAAIIGMFSAGTDRAQTTGAGPPEFEVISIKPTPTASRNSGFRRAAGGVLNATNVTLRFLVGYAYDVRDDQIMGGPGWIDSDRYEVLAKPPAGPAGPETIRQRTQSLLADRFQLVVHRDTKEMPVFALTIGKNGPKGMHESSGRPMDFVTNGHHLDCKGVSMATLAKEFLARQMSRTVVDKTGLQGKFDFTLDWTPDDTPEPPSDSTAALYPSLFSALQEQLGLKLDRQKGPVEVLVIDRVSKPVEN